MVNQAAMVAERRNVPRTEVRAPARLRPNDWSSLEVEVVDFSPQGFRAACDAILKIKSYVTLDVPGFGAVPAQVVWCREGGFGARFLQPIDPRLCGWTRTGEDPLAWEEAAPEEAKEVARLLAVRVRRESRGETPDARYAGPAAGEDASAFS
ncbi:MAG TPA: PilZ domain-containing protein [Allosphingosinicella sp.]|jgi:predicted Fe-S protein YdhL (DUF1289 family)